MRVLLPATATGEDFTFALELAHSLEKDGVEYVLAISHGPLQPHQRASLRALRNVQFVESNFQPDYGDENSSETMRAVKWLQDMARDFDVDVVHVCNATLAGVTFGRPVAVSPPNPTIARSMHSFAPRRKESMIVTADIDAVVGIAAQLSWPVFVLDDAPETLPSFTNLHFLGSLSTEDVSAVLGRAAIFVHTATRNSYAILDAALSGCALVLCESEELVSQWQSAAAFVTDAAPDKLMRALEWLMHDAEARADFGQRAHAKASSFSNGRMSSGYLSLYIDASLTVGRPLASHSS